MPQKPVNPDYYNQMYKILSNAEDKRDLRQMSVWFVLDLSYAREDIALVISNIEKEKGWK